MSSTRLFMARLKPGPSGVVASMGWSGGGDGRERSRATTRDAHHTTPTDKERPPGPGLSDDEAVGEDGAPIPAVLRGWRVGGGANEGHFRVARWESQT